MKPTITIEASPELEEMTDRVLKRFEEITAALERVEKKCDEVIGALNRADTEQNGAEPKRGKWLLHEYPDGYYHTECSECGKVYSENVYFLRKPNYCPNCGAKMERSEE